MISPLSLDVLPTHDQRSAKSVATLSNGLALGESICVIQYANRFDLRYMNPSNEFVNMRVVSNIARDPIDNLRDALNQLEHIAKCVKSEIEDAEHDMRTEQRGERGC